MFKVLFLMCATIVGAFTMDLSELVTCSPVKYPEVLSEFKDVFTKECARNMENPRKSSMYLAGAAFFPDFVQVFKNYDFAALDILINESSLFEMGLQKEEIASLQEGARDKVTTFLDSTKADLRNIALIILRRS